MHRELLVDFLNTVTVSGCEEAGQEKALAYGRGFAHEQRTDPVGNAVSIVNPEAPFKVLLSGHMDEIGFRVTHIGDDGMVHVQKAGGVRPGLYVGAPMQVIHEIREGEKITRCRVCGVGVITDELLKNTEVKDRDLLIDIGAENRESAEKAVSVGDPVCADTQVRELLGHNFTCRALDDKTGAFVILEAARRAAEQNVQCGVYAHTSVGEETTGRGAWMAATSVRPDCAIVVDVTWASDCPGTDPGTTGQIRLGKGPVLCLSGMVNKAMNRMLEETAREMEIPVQYEVAGGHTSTDGDVMLMTGEGVPVALVSIPLRYMHSSVEVANWQDLENAIQLIAGFVKKAGEAAAAGSLDFRPVRAE